jgi:hypothetical protein
VLCPAVFAGVGAFASPAGQRAIERGGAILMRVAAAAAASAAVNEALDQVRQRRQLHHVATDKNPSSTSRGGPWTLVFAPMFERAGMSMNDPANIVPVAGHRGPHPEAYHRAVYDRLNTATQGLTAEEYSAAFRSELIAIGAEVATPGTPLNRMVARQ